MKSPELVLTNLINNAIKYSPENTTIRIQVQPSRKQLLLKVMDEEGILWKVEILFNRYFVQKMRYWITVKPVDWILHKAIWKLPVRRTLLFESKENMGTNFTVSILKS